MNSALPASPPCPEIYRQRLVIEGYFSVPTLDESMVERWLTQLTKQLEMQPLSAPVIFSPNQVSELHHGIGGFQPWAESGCSLYTWSEKNLFTLDIYSCKPFRNSTVIDFVRDTLNTHQLHWRNA